MGSFKTFMLLAGLTLSSAGWSADDIEVPGFLYNQTRTFAGQEFFLAFSSAWQNIDVDSRFSLTINERPSARSGSLLTVTYNGTVVFQRFVGFNTVLARRMGNEATGRVYSAVMTAELDRMLGDDDLVGDGL